MILQLLDLHWLAHGVEQYDLCAHGCVTIQIGPETLATQSDGDWCVSAAALYLLRTLTADHTAQAPVGEHLIPHCGHEMYTQIASADVLIMGCPSGVNWDVLHQQGAVILRTATGAEEYLSENVWQQHVIGFSDTVADFYAASLPKTPTNVYESASYAAFQAEWQRRREAASVPDSLP